MHWMYVFGQIFDRDPLKNRKALSASYRQSCRDNGVSNHRLELGLSPCRRLCI